MEGKNNFPKLSSDCPSQGCRTKAACRVTTQNFVRGKKRKGRKGEGGRSGEERERSRRRRKKKRRERMKLSKSRIEKRLFTERKETRGEQGTRDGQ